MKIIVLAGGLSTERDVSLASAAGICKTLLEKGHDAFLLDVFLGLENAPENLEDVFTLPGHGLEIAKNISETEPDLAAVKASRPDQSDCFFGSECHRTLPPGRYDLPRTSRRRRRKRKAAGFI